MLEIQYIAFSGGHLPSLFNGREVSHKNEVGFLCIRT